MKRKTSPNLQQTRDNPVAQALETATKLADQNADLNRRIRELEDENESLQDALDEISDIVECDDSECTEEDHLEDIAESSQKAVATKRAKTKPKFRIGSDSILLIR